MKEIFIVSNSRGGIRFYLTNLGTFEPFQYITPDDVGVYIVEHTAYADALAAIQALPAGYYQIEKFFKVTL